MKALVFSDSHGITAHMESILTKTAGKMDALLHLGDGYFDLPPLRHLCPDIEFYQVAGNCDPYDLQTAEPSFRLLKLGGKRILMTHGHMFGARAGIHRLSLLAEEQQADICLFGHTHVPLLVNCGNLLIMNPGSISRPRSSRYPSYGVVELDDSVHASVVEIQPDGCHIIL